MSAKLPPEVTKPFVHLHCHTHFSLLDGANRIPELCSHVKSLGMDAVAVTDHGNLYGAIELFREAEAAGIRPIVGYEAYVAPGKRQEKENKGSGGEYSYHLTMLAHNTKGFKNLIKLASMAYLEGFYYKPRIDKEILEAYSEGITVLSGCMSSEFSSLLLNEQTKDAKKLAEWFMRVFKDRFFVEIQQNGIDAQADLNVRAIELADKMGIPLVATCDAHYLKEGDDVSHDVLLCINTGRQRSDENRMRYGSNQFFIRTPEEMYKLFPGHEEAVKRTQEIANTCEIKFDFKKRHFPVFHVPKGKKVEDHLRELAEIGLHERYGKKPSKQAKDRLELELEVVNRLGFASYFLIVWDFVRFAIENGIPAGARGSACGSVLSYVLKISQVDPLEYDLLFERFLDPQRAEAPDIDIDFCQERREEVIQYVKKKYGEESVAQIATFGTMAARAAIKDVGRALGVPLDRVNSLSNLIPRAPLGITIEESMDMVVDLKKEYKQDPQIRELLDIAMKLEGTNRNVGTHAAGVVIANGPITDYVPVQRVLMKGDKGDEDGEKAYQITTQWTMNDLEKVGMLKMDFLGLRTLTLIDKAVKLIEQRRGIKVDVSALPLDDEPTYKLLQSGRTQGVFQFESEGIRNLLRSLKPDNIRDIIASTALYRPGPLQGGMVDSYVNRKHGREQPTYVHDHMKDVLEETHGVMVYQEQVMRILNRLGGIELSSAYACIKAISKKKMDVIDQRRAEFIKGAVKRGVSELTANEIFEQIVVFGGYGFNKCVVGSTQLTDAITGKRTTIRELFDTKQPFTVYGLSNDWKLTPRRVKDVIPNGRKKVYALKTRLGHTIKATGNHPFRTLEGWQTLSELSPGQRIAVSRHQRVKKATKQWGKHELIALGWLLSEGNLCHPTCLYFFSNDKKQVRDFVQAVNVFPQSLARAYQRKNREIYEVCVSTGEDYRFKPEQKPWNSTEVQVAAKPRQKIRSGMYRWAEKLGILGSKAVTKTVPPVVFELIDENIAMFLGRLWSGDGFIANEKLKVPFYATSSRHLARDVQALLLRLGMISRIHEKQFKYRGELRPGYTVHLLGEQSIDTFVEQIAPHCVGRHAAVRILSKYRRKITRDMVSKDTIPPEVRQWVNSERAKAGFTWVELEERSQVSMKEFYGQGMKHKKGFRRATIARLAKFFASCELQQLAESDVFWDSIASIEPHRIEETYDLAVEVDHNFVADGIIVHNSHSAAYALVSYQTAYLKAHYPAEFTAAVITSELGDVDKVAEHVRNTKEMGLEVLPPDINSSDADFGVVGEKTVSFGLVAIRGLGRKAARAIVEERQKNGPYRDLFELCERVDGHLVPRSALESLIKAGGLDKLAPDGNRAALMIALPGAVQEAASLQEDKRRGQGSIFDILGDTPSKSAGKEGKPRTLPTIDPWPAKDKLTFEKESLGFYFSSHPLAQHESELTYASHRILDIEKLSAGADVMIGGMITGVRLTNAKRSRTGDTRMARFIFEDLTGSIECVIFPEGFGNHKDDIVNDKVCFVKASVDRSRDKPGLIINKIIPLDQGKRHARNGGSLRISLDQGIHEPQVVLQLGSMLKRYRGITPVMIEINDPTGKRAVFQLGADFRIDIEKLPMEDVKMLVGERGVHLVGG